MPTSISEERLCELVEEATVDCYGEYEEFDGIYGTLADQLRFPFQARVLGMEIEVLDLDSQQSGYGRGIVARVRRQDGVEDAIGLAELDIAEADPDSAEWLAMYRHWLKGFG